jgi:hypothetical protein
MTELPTLQAALRDTAERTYPRRRRPLIPALLVAAAVAAALLVIRDRDGGQREREVAATPTAATPAPETATPAPTTPPAATPAPETTTPPAATPAPDTTPAKLQKAERVSSDDPGLQGLLGPDHTIVRAWSVPEYKGHVILSRKGDEWCLSAPDPAADQPDIERGSTCAPDARFQSKGIWLGIGENTMEVAPTHGGTAQATGPDGKTRTVKLHGGELAFAHGLEGVEYRLVQIEPGIK